ncbi:MAG: endonuclease III [Alphaproteobacteria bacterium]|nr:endonuclease III [Alphaproteobacteria bacterium]
MKLTPEIYFTEVPPTIDMEIRSELYSTNEFTFAVSVILSAQATDKKVNEVTPGLFSVANTPEKMLALGEEGLKEHIKVISFFNNKAKSILGLADALADGKNDSDYKFPSKYHDRDALMKLPGIGQKTANVIMNVLWGAPFIGVDTHVFRNAHRYGWCGSECNTPEKVEAKLLEIIPQKYHRIVNHVMVLHGRYTCKALRPNCANCPVNKWCPAKII